MERLITRLGFAMIIIGLLGLSQTAFAQQGTDQEYNDLFDDVSNYIPIYEDDLGDGYWGLYYYVEEYMVLNSTLNNNDWWSAFLHETVHVIQDCKNITEELTIFDTNLFQTNAEVNDPAGFSEISWFALGYDEEYYDVEFEAEYIARFSKISYIQSLFDLHCKG